jgi:hypothetical protein
MNIKLGVCEKCRKPFEFCKFNAHHQKYCMRSGCIHKRTKKRQSEYQNKRYHADGKYSARQRKNSRENARRRRGKEKVDAEARQKEQENIDTNPVDVLMGVIAQLTGESNPKVVHKRFADYGVRGQQLSHQTQISGSS